MIWNIKLSPIRADKSLSLAVAGTVLTINGEELDLSLLGDGDTLPRDAVPDCWHLVSAITRVGSTISLTLLLPHGTDAPESVRFPDPLLIETDGPVALPEEA